MTNARRLFGLPLKLKTGIDAGGEYTVHEWAEQLEVNDSDIRRALSALRRTHGFHQYHPIGTKRGHKGQQGVIRDINTKKEFIEETLNNQRNIYLDPQLVAFSHWFESGYQKFPQLRPLFKAYLSDEMAKLTIMDERFKNENR